MGKIRKNNGNNLAANVTRLAYTPKQTVNLQERAEIKQAV
jgi:hypothetical protein